MPRTLGATDKAPRKRKNKGILTAGNVALGVGAVGLGGLALAQRNKLGKLTKQLAQEKDIRNKAEAAADLATKKADRTRKLIAFREKTGLTKNYSKEYKKEMGRRVKQTREIIRKSSPEVRDKLAPTRQRARQATANRLLTTSTKLSPVQLGSKFRVSKKVRKQLAGFSRYAS